MHRGTGAGLERGRAPPPPSARELGSSPRAPAGREAGNGRLHPTRPGIPQPRRACQLPAHLSILSGAGGSGRPGLLATRPRRSQEPARLRETRSAPPRRGGCPRTAPGPGLGRGGGRVVGAWPSRSSPAPDLKLTRSRRERLPRARSLPSPTPALSARGPARQSAPLHGRRGESGCRHRPPTPPAARLGEKSSKTFPIFFFFFFLFANTLYPRSKLGDEIWLDLAGQGTRAPGHPQLGAMSTGAQPGICSPALWSPVGPFPLPPSSGLLRFCPTVSRTCEEQGALVSEADGLGTLADR
ncbi:transcription initiation factor TFIID subunit 4-like isoform X2 [Cricetulus griseus]|uniref:Transcription initiation factor TFIID subunit 4-like isoform X2 n=1 Tax=Cricetulus griseus TaxID=10029 RepID=A0A9J7GUV3_CRIGR|nr:transcription initiation factor TFIID subunit 4-like isoform X2 [Cricetulus griseus]